MSGNIRKQLGPVRKRLRDRIAEVRSDKDVDNLKSLKGKLKAGIDSHEKIYVKLYSLADVSEQEQGTIDQELTTSAELEIEANEAFQEVIRFIEEGEKSQSEEKFMLNVAKEKEIAQEITRLRTVAEENKVKLTELSKDDSGTGLSTNISSSAPKVRLPVLPLPSFSGNVTEWPSFWDSFSSSIHDNIRVAKIDKFKYLKGALLGEAKDVLSGFSVTEAQYDVAVSMLKERYDDTEFIIHQHYGNLSAVQKCPNVTKDLRKTFNFIETQIRSLQSLKENVENNYMVSLIKSKLPESVNLKLEENRDEPWTLPLLRKNIQKLISARERSESQEILSVEDETSPTYSAEGLLGREVKFKCYFCDGPHWTDECQKFKTLKERRVQARGRCFVCLSNKHFYRECHSQKACYYCQQKGNHHSSLCPKEFNRETELCALARRLRQSSNGEFDVLMKIAKVKIVNAVTGEGRVVIALFDTGAKRSYIIQEVAEKLNLETGPAKAVQMNTFGSSKPSKIQTRRTEVMLEECDGSSRNIKAKICENITGKMTQQKVDVKKYENAWRGLHLANGVPADTSEMFKIEMLVGNDYYDDIIKDEKIPLDEGLYLVKSTVGWIFSGRVKREETEELSMLVDDDDDDLQKSLWDLEAIGVKTVTEESIKKENRIVFEKNLVKKNNRYNLSWLWKESRYELPDNLPLCKARLKSLVQASNKEDLKGYNDIIQKYAIDEMIEKVNNNDEYLRDKFVVVHYLPHHMVKNGEKRRIVFEGNAKTNSSKRSLNDCLHRGENLVSNLCGVLLRFRMHVVGVIADIEKAYLQLGLNETDRDVVRFLWLKDVTRPFSGDNIQVFRFRRVIWGIICAAFLLSATIMYHLSSYDSEVSRLIVRDLYVDNLITGGSNKEEVIDIYKETKRIFNGASMNMRQWMSNEPQVMNYMDEKDKCDEKMTKVLGLMWNLGNDELSLAMWSGESDVESVTKRDVLRAMSKVYDSLGLLCPIMVRPKKLLQDLWKLGIGWDDQIPNDLKKIWKSYVQDFSQLHTVRRERCVDRFPPSKSKQYEVIAFCDASGHTYATVVYLKVSDGSNCTTELVFSKTRLGPAKEALTIPRMELMGLLIGCRASKYVVEQLGIKGVRRRIFTDSKCALEWCRSSKDLKRFVKERVNEIRSHEVSLGYVCSKENPADIASRGESIQKLKGNDLWWKGPQWLSMCEEKWPSTGYELNDELMASIESEKKKNVFEMGLPAAIAESSSLLGIEEEHFSSYCRLLRVTAWCFRFIDALRGQRSHSKSLLCKEIKLAETKWIRSIQKRYFADGDGLKPRIKKNTLRQLGVYTDEQGFMRCGGRFYMADVHPKLLPKVKDSWYSKLVVHDKHKRMKHVGESQTLAEVRKEYWVIQGRASVKLVIGQCLVCKRWEGGPFKTPPFAPYPEFVMSNESSAFTFVGLDYLGPLVTRDNNLLKVWICLFTCLKVRAIHLEIVENMSACSFLLCLRRFVARRGTPKLIISDNASQFKTGNMVVQDVWRDAITDKDVVSYVANQRIEWKFTFEHAPWQGGFYERLVGLTKRSLRKSFGKSILTRSEMSTLIVEAEAVINARPLCYVGDDINSGFVLSPAHFLSLKCGHPQLDEQFDPQENLKSSLISLWRKGQHCLNVFWSCWNSEYLPALRERSKYGMQPTKGEIDRFPLPGEVVLIKEEGIPRGSWKIARISSLMKSGVDGIERAARLLLPSGKYLTRPFKFLYPLEVKSSMYKEDLGEVQKNEEKGTPDVRRLPRVAAANARRKIKDLCGNED